MASLFESVKARIAQYPRVSRLVGVVGLVAIVAFPLRQLVPQELTIRYDFGTASRDVHLLRVAYLPAGQDSTRVLTQRFPDGAPRQYDHHVDLQPGRYEVHTRVETPAGVIERVRYIEVGHERTIPVDLSGDGN